MSLYHCSCGDKTDVIDTRNSYQRLRRRRKCKNGHRFSTVEVPLEATAELKAMIHFWATETGIIDDDFIFYAGLQIDKIMLGVPIPDG